MRVITPKADLRAYAIAGSRIILVALDCAESKRSGLMGFAFKRETVGGPASDWLRGLKVFKQVNPDPKPNQTYSTFENPIQSFLWSDYTAKPDTQYRITIAAMYGEPGALRQGDTLTLTVRTEKADDGRHGIWFNRGSIASQAFAREFDNAAMTEEIANDPRNKMTAWLSRGLVEACLGYINDTPAGNGLRVCAYEFTYPPVLEALKAALDRGVDVKIIYHKASANDKAVEDAELPETEGRKQILFERTKTKIPHNKFIVRLDADGEPTAVWTGSTNFTASGFLGQTNVGHLVTGQATARTYLDLWNELTGDPDSADAKVNAMALTPNPPNFPGDDAMVTVFSPRFSDKMLDWYEQRIEDAKSGVFFTGAFGVDPHILAGLEKHSDAVRFILLEKPPTAEIREAQRKNIGDVLVSYGAVLGQTYQSAGTKGAKKLAPIPKFELDRWFLKEELARRDGSGFVFFIHTKFLLVDPLSDCPLVCTGSANFSKGSLVNNDENMLLICGDTRVADIYLTEFDRIFRHFYFRDVADQVAKSGGKSDTIFLRDSDAWTAPYFDEGRFNHHRREMFFDDPGVNWTQQAPGDEDVFADEASKPKRRVKPKATGASKTARRKKPATRTKTKRVTARRTPTKRKATGKRPTAKRTAKRASPAKRKRASR